MDWTPILAAGVPSTIAAIVSVINYYHTRAARKAAEAAQLRLDELEEARQEGRDEPRR